MTQSISKKLVVITCLATAVGLGMVASVEAQLFGNRLFHRNRHQDPCCPPVWHNPCCPTTHHGWHQSGWQQNSSRQMGWQQPWQNNQPIAFNIPSYSSAVVSAGNTDRSGVMQAPGQDWQEGTSGSSGAAGWIATSQPQMQTQQAQQLQPQQYQTQFDQNIAASGSPSLGQQDNRMHRTFSVRPDEQQFGKTGAMGGSAEQQMTAFLARKLALQNDSIAEKADRSRERISSSDIKDLAQEIAEAHRELAVAFQDLSGTRTSETGQQQAQQSDLGPYTTLYEICVRADREQQEEFESTMSDYSDEEIDMAFLGTQLVNYRAMLPELNAMRQAINESDLKSKIGETIEVVETQLQKAEKVYEEIRDEISG